MKKASIFLLLLLILLLSACGTNTTQEQSGETFPSESETENETISEGENTMTEYDFSVFKNVEIIGADLSAMSNDELGVLYQQARYCQAMTDADTDTLREIIAEDAVFTHMSGRQQSREEYFADIENGSLRYFTIGIDGPIVEVDGDIASVTFTSVLNANAYGARGTYRMSGTHYYELRGGEWISINNPNNR